jgi:hypothetical protein
MSSDSSHGLVHLRSAYSGSETIARLEESSERTGGRSSRESINQPIVERNFDICLL